MISAVCPGGGTSNLAPPRLSPCLDDETPGHCLDATQYGSNYWRQVQAVGGKATRLPSAEQIQALPLANT